MDLIPVGIPSQVVSAFEVSEGLVLPLKYLRIYIAASLMVLYSDSSVIVPNDNHMQRNSNFSIFVVHFDAICTFAWM